MNHIHIIGIGGTFMGGLAALAKEAGFTVTGCDAKMYPPMSTQLEALGIAVHEGFDAEQLDRFAADIYVIGNVAKRGMPVVEAILNRALPYTSGPQWLAENVLAGRWILGVAGTHGKTLSRDQALKLLLNPPKPEAASEPAAKAEPVEVPTISENTDEGGSTDSDTPPAAPQKLTPPDSGNSKSRISRQDLNAAIDAHNQANDSIRSAWRNIDPTIQQDLVDEQREWERRKATSCGNAAAKGNSAVESQYLRMQCDTRLTRERVQYLKGFSIE